jgi:hypothetical protein
MRLFFVLQPIDTGKPVLAHTPVMRTEIGIITTQDIPKGTKLPLFANDDYKLWRLRDVRKLPALFRERLLKYGVLDRSGLHGPKYPSQMSIGWYIRHSDDPTTRIDEEYDYFARRDIKAGEEITVDLHTLGDERYPPRMRQKR